MLAVKQKEIGGPEHLYIGEVPKPGLKNNEILVKVHATALNRADILQREGKYPPPSGASEIMGLELAGEVVDPNDSSWQAGDQVFGLVPGGAYAQYCALDKSMAIDIPEGITYEQAAAIPEAFLTAYQALVWHAQITSGEKVLIHAGASGVGTAAIQLAKQKGAYVVITASKSKHELCSSLGADMSIDYKTEDFEKVIKDNLEGVDVIIDFLAAPYFQKNLNCINLDGRMVMLALMGGIKTDANLAPILSKRISIIGSTLRSRPLSYQQKLNQEFIEFALPLITQHQLHPVIDCVMNWNQVDRAQEYMEANQNKGKIVLKIEH